MGHVPPQPPPAPPSAYLLAAFAELAADCPPPPGLYDDPREYLHPAALRVVPMYPNPSTAERI